jgi:hypothetical protein
MKKIFLPLIALLLIGLIYFGINGVKAEFSSDKTNKPTKIIEPSQTPLNIVAVDTATPSLTAIPSAENKIESEPSPEVSNIAAPSPSENQTKVTLRINAGSAAGNYPVLYMTGETAYQFLVRIASTNHFTVNAKDYGWGMFVEGIGNLNNTRDICWFFYINGKISEVGSSAYQVLPNDLIEWRYHEYWIY